MLIDFKIIPHKHQRYDTVGDYYRGAVPTLPRESWWKFRVSRMKDQRFMLLVFLHEIIEFMLCRHAGIKMKDIDDFDMGYIGPYEEPGDDPAAPYHSQHLTATACERLIAKAMGVQWHQYDKTVNEL